MARHNQRPKVDLRVIIEAQHAELLSLATRVAELEARPEPGGTRVRVPATIAKLTQPQALGTPGQRVICGVQSHGSVALNKRGECPHCHNQRIKVECEMKRRARTAEIIREAGSTRCSPVTPAPQLQLDLV